MRRGKISDVKIRRRSLLDISLNAREWLWKKKEKLKTLHLDNDAEIAHCVSLELICIKSAPTEEQTYCTFVSRFSFHHESIQSAQRWVCSDTLVERRTQDECLHSLINRHAFLIERSKHFPRCSFVSVFFCSSCIYPFSWKRKFQSEACFFAFFRLTCWQGFCMCILWGEHPASWEVFYRLYNRTAHPSRDSQTDTNHFDMSFFFPASSYRIKTSRNSQRWTQHPGLE